MIWVVAWISIGILAFKDQLSEGRFFGILIVSFALQFLCFRIERRLQRRSIVDGALDDNEKLRERIGELEQEIYNQESRIEDLREEAKSAAVYRPYPKGTTLVKIDTLVEFRNLLLMHHNGRETDKSYVSSHFSKRTNDTVAALNVFLDKKKGRSR